jgi:small subunit ribosomal protein S8
MDPLGDMLTRIRNAQSVRHSTVRAPYSRLHERVLEVLKREGYIRTYATREHAPGKNEIVIELKYYQGAPAISEIARVSRPGRRVYSRIKDLPRPHNGLGIAVLSTPVGVLSDGEARAKNVGGEVLCQVF